MNRLFARALTAVGLATVLLMVWGMLFWGVLYEPLDVYRELPDEPAVVSALIEADTPTGTYFYPWPRDTPAAMAAFRKAHAQGPFFHLAYVREGVDPQSPGKLLAGSLHHAGVAALAALLMWIAAPGLPRMRQRFLVVWLAGCLGTAFARLGEPIWFHLPWGYAGAVAVYEIGAWTCLGLALAPLIEREGVTGGLERARTA